MKNKNNVATIQGERPLLDQTRVNGLIKIKTPTNIDRKKV